MQIHPQKTRLCRARAQRVERVVKGGGRCPLIAMTSLQGENDFNHCFSSILNLMKGMRLMKEKRKKDEIWQAITCRLYQNLCSNMQRRLTILSMTMTMIILWMTILSMTDHPGFHSHWSSCGLRKHKTRWSGGFLGRCPRKVSFHVLDKKNSWKVSFHTSINRTTSALLKWDFMLLKKCLKKVRLHAIEWWTVHSKYLPIAYMLLTHYSIIEGKRLQKQKEDLPTTMIGKHETKIPLECQE